MNAKAPPTIIAFASPKGGAGKSTSCLSIAGALASEGHKVQVIDFDASQTLFRWYEANPSAREIKNLTVERGPDTDIADFIRDIWHNRSGVVLIDLAGALTDKMLHVAAFADLIITPAKLSEPDILEANKLYQQLIAIGTRIGKPIKHRILINEVPSILAAFQIHLLDELRSTALPRFENLVHYRAAYPESFLTGLPAHFATAKERPTISKAVAEINALVDEIYAIINQQEKKEAA